MAKVVLSSSSSKRASWLWADGSFINLQSNPIERTFEYISFAKGVRARRYIQVGATHLDLNEEGKVRGKGTVITILLSDIASTDMMVVQISQKFFQRGFCDCLDLLDQSRMPSIYASLNKHIFGESPWNTLMFWRY